MLEDLARLLDFDSADFYLAVHDRTQLLDAPVMYHCKEDMSNHWHYSLQLIIVKDNCFLGVITLYRILGKEDFQYNDVFVLDMLKDHLAYRLQQQTLKTEGQEKVTISEAVEKYDLTRRENTILQMLMPGKENAYICEELAISANTLKNIF